jgi:DUF1009 family protein
MSLDPKLGILAGGGELPARIIAACRASGREFFVLAFEGEAAPETVEGTPHAWVRLGEAAEGLARLREAGVRELVLAGGVRRPSLKSLRPDRRALRFLTGIGKAMFRDGGLLAGIVTELEKEGFRIVGADSLVGDLLAAEGCYGAVEPDEVARADIARGIEVARAIGAIDLGQAVVVQQGVVLGVEAIEGTDALIRRCGGLRRAGPGGVLVKVRKPKQDRRVDLPTVGLATVGQAAEAGLRGIAVEAGGALVIDRHSLVKAADEAGLFVIGVPVPK